MIRKVLLSMALGMSAGSALAADLPTMKGPAPFAAPPVFTWAGFYVGANIGYAWGSARTVTTLDLASSWGIEAVPFRDGWASLASGSRSATGVIGGLQAGYNWQSGSLVFGVELDGSLSSIRGSTTTPPTCVPGFCPAPAYVWTRSVKVDSLFTLRPRIGLAADRALFYVTGGLALGNVSGSWSVLGNNGYSKSGSDSSFRAGWTVGGGIEYAVTNNWTVKGEYLYTNLGTATYNSVYNPGSTFAPPGFNYRESISQSLNFHTVRAGLNYKF